VRRRVHREELAARVAFGWSALNAAFGLDRLTPGERERWAVDHGLLLADGERAGRGRWTSPARLWRAVFLVGGEVRRG
jgi:hypothetical protein